jgi:oligosaccharide repeat unit polymerase
MSINIVKINRTKTQLITTTFVLILLIGLLGLIFSNNINPVIAETYTLVFSWVGWLLIAWCVWSWYRLRDELLCPYIIFIFVAFIFMYGQSLLLTFGIIPEQRDIRRMFDLTSIMHAQIFTCIGLGFFHLGALIFAKKPSYSTINQINDDNKKVLSNHAIKIVGYTLFFISVGPFLYILIKTLKLVYSEGYRAIYDPRLVTTGLSINKLSDFAGDFFVLALICLLVVYSKNLFMRNAILFLVILKILSNLYIGGRTPALVLIICVLCIWHYCVERIIINKAIILLVAGYFFLSILSIVANLRGMAERDLLLYWTVFLESLGKDNLFILTISEMGWSMSPLVWVMKLVPSYYDFLYGSSYFYAFSTIIPNLGFWDVHPGGLNATLGHWLQMVLGLTYGPGFSSAAEAYRNFGWAGFAPLFVLGSFYGWVFSLIHKESASKKPELLCFVLILLSLTLTTSRSSFIATVRAVFYYALPIYLSIQFTKGYLKKHSILKRRKDKANINYLSCDKCVE